MAIKIVVRKAKAKAAEGKKPARPAFEYNKIVTPATKRGGKDEAKDATVPTFAEMVEQIYKGSVEMSLDKDGNSTGISVVEDLINARNLAWNQDAAFNATNTIESAAAKLEQAIAEQAKKFGVTVEALKAMLATK